MNRSLIVILATITLNAIGMGIIHPILPAMLRDLTNTSDIAIQYGCLVAVFALMQVLCAPILGTLSDRFGRRTVLLACLGGAAIHYLTMSATSSLWVLYIVRMIGGATSASSAVATAYVTDIVKPDQRAKYFGFIGSCFGIGLIVGPALGGWLGEASLRYPFLLAAALNGANCLLGWFALRESRTPSSRTLSFKGINPFSALGVAFRSRAWAPLLTIFAFMAMISQAGNILWIIDGQQRFGWSSSMLGLSLTAFGLAQASVQLGLTGPTIARLGEFRSLVLSVVVQAMGYILLGLSTAGWMALSLIPLLCFAGIGKPALQALIAREVDADRQGQMQGVLSSLTAVSSILVPLSITSLYAVTSSRWGGLIWIVSALAYLLCIPMLVRYHSRACEAGDLTRR